MGSIFVSYRRDGGSGFAGRIEADLQRRFGPGEVFRDVDDLASGEDFVQGLQRALRHCRVLIVVVSKTWLNAADTAGARRLDDPRDFVRQEIAAALARADVHVIPVLVEGARMPSEADLPDELKPLARRQAHELADSRWDYDMSRLADNIAATLGQRGGREPGTGKRRWVLAAAVVIAIGAVAGWRYLSRPPDLDGTWDLPNGSYWTISQSGRELTIQEVHYETRQVWKKGRGSIDGDFVDFKLGLVFETGASTEGRLRITDGGRRLQGVATTLPRSIQDDLVLSRR